MARRDVMRLARGQHGVVHVGQAGDLGMSKDAVYRLTRAREWQLLLPNVVYVSAGDPDWRARAAASCLWGGSGVGASHSTAGALWEFDSVAPRRIAVSFHGRKQSPRPWLEVHESSTPFTIHHRQGIPVTSATRTLVDLAGIVGRGQLELALEDALRRGLTTVGQLREEHSKGAVNRAGAAALGDLLRARDPGERPTGSALEVRVLRALERAGIPRPVCQHEVEGPGGFRARLDFAFVDARIALEADGFRWHSSRRAWRRDRRRLNQLTSMGWRVVHVTPQDLADGAAEATKLLRELLGQRHLPYGHVPGSVADSATIPGMWRGKPL